MSAHSHSFSSWPFAEAINTTSFICDHVHESGAAILRVCHDPDGDWQFLCDRDHSDSKPILICLGCAVERDTPLLQIADLPIGWVAARATAQCGWWREALPVDEDR